MKLLRASPDAAGAIAELHRLAHAEAIGQVTSPLDEFVDRWESPLAAGDRMCFRAVIDMVTVGFISATLGDGVGQIEDLFVLPTHRRRGVARRLVEAVLGVEPRCRRWTLSVEETNTAALALYDSLGFESTGNAHTDDRSTPPRVMLEMGLHVATA